MIGIYKFTNKFNQKSYIGQSIDIERRYNVHKRISLKKDGKTYWEHAIQKYGIENFNFDILIECPKENLNYWEKFYIRYYCSNDRKFGYNMTFGGDGISEWTDEMRIKQSIIHLGQISHMKGKHLSEDTKQKLRVANLGKKQSTETIEKRRQKMIGHSISLETRKKISDAQKGKIIPLEQREKISNTLKGNIPWNKGKSGYTIKKSGKRTPEQCKNISDGIKNARKKKI